MTKREVIVGWFAGAPSKSKPNSLQLRGACVVSTWVRDYWEARNGAYRSHCQDRWALSTKV